MTILGRSATHGVAVLELAVNLLFLNLLFLNLLFLNLLFLDLQFLSLSSVDSAFVAFLSLLPHAYPARFGRAKIDSSLHSILGWNLWLASGRPGNASPIHNAEN
jgi:hypothetical protein